MDEATVALVRANPRYQELLRARTSFGWSLTIVMLVIYYGFIALVAFWPKVIGLPISSGITLGLPLGMAVIVSAVILTGIYVARANSQFDRLSNQIAVDVARVGTSTREFAGVGGTR